MRSVAILVLLALNAGSAFAEACWSEWLYNEQWLIRAHQCTENVSLHDFAKGFCQSRIEGDELRKADKCPATVLTRDGSSVITGKVMARCIGLHPPGVDGTATRIFYDHPNFARDKEKLRKVCVAAQGQWQELKP